MESLAIEKIRESIQEISHLDYQPVSIYRGYAGRYLKVDLSDYSIKILPVDEKMKQLWTGGKGFDLWITLKEINKNTKWNSPENPICMSQGPLGGTVSFPGSGKTIVTSISPLTGSIMDCNVGGYFGPYLKFAGFDALEIIGKASEEVIIFIDATKCRVSIQKAPIVSIDSHLASEELTMMFADDEEDRRNISVVSSGRGAQHARMGILNFSFYDWRRQVPRLKQAGRGGIGTVFRDKKLKALVVKSRELQHAWKVTPSKVSRFFPSEGLEEIAKRTDRKAIRKIIEKWNSDPEYVIEMMQDVQDLERCISMAAIDEISLATGVSRGRLYHIATFYKAFSLVPRGEIEVQVCVGTTCHVKGSALILEAFERELGISRGGTTPDFKFSVEAVACLGCCSLAPVVKFGEEVVPNVQSKDVAKLIKKFRSRG